MNAIPNYQILAQIYESASSLVYRGLRHLDGKPVILKILNQEYPTPEARARFRLEYDIICNLNIEGVIRAYGLENYQHSLMMILEDFGGEALAKLIAYRSLTLVEVLNIGVRIAEILGDIHAVNIIHKDINPDNIVVNLDPTQVKIIDFGIATLLSWENSTIKNPNVLEGTLAYMWPEQTGRMNRGLDYRTDFYSLGVTLYELLTHQRPFQTNDAMELVHCHIAKQPVPPHLVNLEIPKVVSDIVMKLLAKNAEDRYQSADGMAADLHSCLFQLQDNDRIVEFPLGHQDISDKFQIPQKLYGRQQQVKTLLKAFEHVSHIGGSEMMLVSGYSGIGKSALVQEIYKPITEQRGYFISGKFDQYQRNIPYSAVVIAFQSLVRQLLTESECQLEQWKQKILAAVGDNGEIIIDVIPEVELIVGIQPAVVELGPTESQNRFNLVFKNFIRVFCQPEHPLVIFLDDLQWADSATLKLIELMMTDAQTQYLFLIGAYRDNEVSPTHPLTIALDILGKQDVIVNQIILSPLELENITQLIAETLHSDSQTVLPLAELVLSKTQGNPFFVNQFLYTLYQSKLIAFNRTSPQCSLTKEGITGVWQWDIEQIKAMGITDNVVELMLVKVKKLPESTQQVLQLAACIGNQFDLKTLFIVNEKSQLETAKELGAAIQEGLIVTLGNNYKLFPRGMQDIFNNLIVTYKFLHDRVQQAAYSLIPEERKQVVHRKVGQLLLRNTTPDKREEKIFDIVNHLNFGIELINSESERNELAQLNLIAGKKAKLSTAYEPALRYLNVGMELLGADSWQKYYDLTLALYVEATEVAYLCTYFDEIDRLAAVVLKQAKTLLDKVKVYEVKIQAFIVQNKLVEAVNTALPVLKLLGVKFPSQPSKLHILLGMQQTKLALTGKRIERLIDLPEMTDPHKLAAMRLASSVFSAAYLAVPELFPLFVFKLVNLSIKYGNAPISAYVYACYGIILCGVVFDIDSGYQFGKLGLSLLERFNAKDLKAKTLLVFNTFVKPWQDGVRETLQPAIDGYQIGLETGDLEYAAYSALTHSYHSYFAGAELVAAEREMAKYSNAIAQIKQQTALNYNELYRQAALRLINGVEVTSGNGQDELQDRNLACRLYSRQLILGYLFEEYDRALSNAIIAEKYLDGVTSSLDFAIFHFYDSLTRLAVFADASKLEQKRILRKVKANQKKMQRWAHHAPMNFLHKFYLVEAERHRVLGEHTLAIEYYDRAIENARLHEYINEEALSHELAAKFYLAKGKAKIAQVYILDARYCYLRWGATAKVRDLEARYPQLLERACEFTSTITTASGSSETLDLTTVMKASLAISSEIFLDKLLATLMKILIENAGAQKGYLILETNGKLMIEASGAVDTDSVTVLQSIPIESSQAVSASIINYVARTKESAILNDATGVGSFTNDPYIIEKQPKSVLCYPIQTQGKLTGLLYLENNLTTGAFTPDRLEVLKLLSSHVAISLENARLYEQLEDYSRTLEVKVEERTQELQQEIQERISAEAALRLSEEKFSKAFRSTPAAISISTLTNGRFIEVNDSFLSLTGYCLEEVIGHTSIELNIWANPEDRNLFMQVLQQQGIVRNYEVEFRTKSGESKIVLLSAELIALDGTLCLLNIANDITYRIQAEEEIRKALSKEREYIELKSHFISMASHELRTPLTTILTSSDILKHYSHKIKEGKKLDYLNKIQEQVRNMTGLLDDILFVGKAESGRMQFNPLPLNLSEFSREIISDIELTDNKKHTFCFDFQGESSTVEMDEKLVRKFLTNLLSNAVKYSPKGGMVQLQVVCENNQAIFKIRDEGIGIPASDRERLFEVFHRASNVGKISGTGLGMSIVKQAVGLHGGTISFESEEGVGTTFIVCVPTTTVGL